MVFQDNHNLTNIMIPEGDKYLYTRSERSLKNPTAPPVRPEQKAVNMLWLGRGYRGAVLFSYAWHTWQFHFSLGNDYPDAAVVFPGDVSTRRNPRRKDPALYCQKSGLARETALSNREFVRLFSGGGKEI